MWFLKGETIILLYTKGTFVKKTAPTLEVECFRNAFYRSTFAATQDKLSPSKAQWRQSQSVNVCTKAVKSL